MLGKKWSIYTKERNCVDITSYTNEFIAFEKKAACKIKDNDLIVLKREINLFFEMNMLLNLSKKNGNCILERDNLRCIAIIEKMNISVFMSRKNSLIYAVWYRESIQMKKDIDDMYLYLKI